MSPLALDAGLWPSLALIGMLGLRHGFDADHIAVIDGMTRTRQLHHSYWGSRLVGLQFAFGHSAAIGIASLLLVGQRPLLPDWLDGLGIAISVAFLLLVAASNLGHALRPAGAAAPAPGPCTALLFRLTGRSLPPVAVGVAFALSFDALAQAAFFASHGSAAHGSAVVVLLAAVFGLGMMLADAANGALLYWFASRSDRLARQASRFSSGFIALVALLAVGALLLRESAAGFAQAWDDAGVWIGVGLVALTSVVYALRLSLQRQQRGAVAR